MLLSLGRAPDNKQCMVEVTHHAMDQAVRMVVQKIFLGYQNNNNNNK